MRPSARVPARAEGQHLRVSQVFLVRDRSAAIGYFGQVSREEWTGVGDDENAGAGAQGGYFDSMDENMDGQVTLEEFNAARGSAYEAAQGAAEAEGADTSSGVPVYHYRFYTN